jgi:hypothetical protein
MPCSAMDLTPLFAVSRSLEWYFIFLISGLLLAVSMIATIPTIHYIDLPIFMLPLL